MEFLSTQQTIQKTFSMLSCQCVMPTVLSTPAFLLQQTCCQSLTNSFETLANCLQSWKSQRITITDVFVSSWLKWLLNFDSFFNHFRQVLYLPGISPVHNSSLSFSIRATNKSHSRALNTERGPLALPSIPLVHSFRPHKPLLSSKISYPLSLLSNNWELFLCAQVLGRIRHRSFPTKQ